MTRIFDPKRKGKYASALGSGADPAVFDSAGAASVSDASKFLAQFGGASVLGEPGNDEVEGTAGNASATITVPTGKYWRLVGLYHTLVTDANVANRAVVVTTRTTADATIEAITHANVAASTTAKRTTLFGTAANVRGDRAVAAQGTLSMATKPTATNTMTINGVAFTWVAALTGAANELLIGADAAASQAALEDVFVTFANYGTTHSVSTTTVASTLVSAIAFSSDDMVFTALTKGTAGNSIATTETFTAGGNVFDAATLGTTTAGLDAADKVSTLDHPTAGPYLGPGEDINISVTNGVAGDSLDTYLFYLEFDSDVS
jgi:hypothetical protein